MSDRCGQQYSTPPYGHGPPVYGHPDMGHSVVAASGIDPSRPGMGHSARGVGIFPIFAISFAALSCIIFLFRAPPAVTV